MKNRDNDGYVRFIFISMMIMSFISMTVGIVIYVIFIHSTFRLINIVPGEEEIY
jgi:uncharacterized membrane protein